MGKSTLHTHPHPIRYRIQQWSALALLGVMLLAVPFQLGLAVALSGVLFGLTALTLLLLAAPVIMLLSVSPAVRVDEAGLELLPFVGQGRRIAWADIRAIQPYTLLPQPEMEMEKRAWQGRKKYRAAVGNMLIIPGLPWRYRIAGFFAGAGGQPIIALTNRTHTDYDALMQRIEKHWQPPA